MSLTVIVPTAGRDTLTRTLESVAPQLEDGDELIVVRADCEYGNQSRDSAMRRAAGDHLVFVDDDDVSAPDALTNVRRAVEAEPDRVHIFRMLDHDGVLRWTSPELKPGYIGAPMVVVPNTPGKLGHWDNERGALSDFEFLEQTLCRRGDKPVWHEEVIAVIRP